MISVYINKYNPIAGDAVFSNGNQETLMFSIPNTDQKELFITASVTNEMGSAGNFEFTIHPKSKYYDLWIHMRTLIRVEYDGDTIFFGRVLTIDRDMFRNKKIHCEGAMTFFMDSVMEGNNNGFTLTLEQYLQKLIEAHNECMTDAPEKKIYLGEVPGRYSQSIVKDQKINDGVMDTQKYAKNKGYKTIKEWLDELIGDYAGQMRVRYDNGTLRLDWMKNYYNASESNQKMSVSSNVIDLSDTVEVNNIFTHVIPVGKNNKYIGQGGGGGGGGGGAGSGKYTCTFSASPANGGKVYCNSTANSSVNADEGDVLNFTANPTPVTESPSDNWKFDHWQVTPVTVEFVGQGMRASLKMPKSNVHVTGFFVNAGGSGGDQGLPVTE